MMRLDGLGQMGDNPLKKKSILKFGRSWENKIKVE
jgi:hypothetical protein